MIPDEQLSAIVAHFDLRPKGIIQMLDAPDHSKTAAYGHFGRDEPEFTWERTDQVQALRAAALACDVRSQGWRGSSQVHHCIASCPGIRWRLRGRRASAFSDNRRMNQLDAQAIHHPSSPTRGTFRQLAQFQPRDATTNPSLILKPFSRRSTSPRADTVARFRKQPLDEVMDRLLVRFGCEICRSFWARVPQVDAPER